MLDRHNWAQPLRAVQHHLSRLERVYLVGSVESQPQLTELQGLLGRCGLSCQVECHAWGADFERVEVLVDLLDGVVVNFLALGYDESEIVLDSTSGPRPTSIGAALVTLNRDATFQYVTNKGSVLGELRMHASS